MAADFHSVKAGLSAADSGGILVRAPEGATIIGSGETASGLLSRALRQAPVLVAADGGAARALECGYMPEAVIGDMDSLPDQCRQNIQPGRLHRIGEQDSTDLDKCIRSIEAPLLVGIGVCGPRADHGLSSLHSLLCNPQRTIILVTATDVIFLCPPEFRLEAPVGSRVSLFPMGRSKGHSAGLKWNIDGLPLSPGEQIACSNESAANEIGIQADQPNLLMILPITEFENAVHCLAATETWKHG